MDAQPTYEPAPKTCYNCNEVGHISKSLTLRSLHCQSQLLAPLHDPRPLTFDPLHQAVTASSPAATLAVAI